MIVHIIESFKDFGYTNFTICVNYKSEQIKDYFKDGANFGVHIDYIEEKKRLGTAGALSLLKNVIIKSIALLPAAPDTWPI